MKRFLAATILCLLWTVAVHASETHEWCTGIINLTNNEQIDASMWYDASTELIQVKTGNTIKVYSARQVQSFQYFDSQTNAVRQYESHLYAVSHYRKARVFFEVVLSGQMQVLRRFKSWKMAKAYTEAKRDQLWYDSNHVYDYLIHTQDTFVAFHHFKKVILPQLLSEYGDALQAFMKKHHLTVFSQRGQLLVINRYNVLKNAEAVARNL